MKHKRRYVIYYEVQSEKAKGELQIEGASSLKEAIDKLLNTCKHFGYTRGYIWPQTKTAKRCINGRYNADYLCIDNIIHEKNKVKYVLKPRSVVGANVEI